MKKLHLSILLLLTVQLGIAQYIDVDLIRYKGLSFYTTKSAITKVLGKAEKIYDPNYDCGFLSTAIQEGEFQTLDYGSIKFTGNEQELYLLELVDMENDDSIVVKYGDRNLSCETTLSELIEIFGASFAKQFGEQKEGSIKLFHEKADDGIRVSIKNGKLIRLEYWSPC